MHALQTAGECESEREIEREKLKLSLDFKKTKHGDVPVSSLPGSEGREGNFRIFAKKKEKNC